VHHRYANGQSGNERTRDLKIQLREAAGRLPGPCTIEYLLGLKDAARQSDARLEDSL
jgi:hypothetical protein